jgi:glycosyltransferase involved in cell wall biosynthesis
VAAKRRVIYATSGWCIHDTRWFAALEDNDLSPVGMSITDDPGSLPPGVLTIDSPEVLRAKVDGLARDASHTGGLSILAGPLTTVTRHLVGVDARLVGLSWGWDLQPEALGQPFDADELAWVSMLDALIVDSVVTRAVAERLGLTADRINLIPWGIDTELFTPDGPKADLSVWGVRPGDRVVLSLRSHTRIHRVGDIIEAFAIAVREDPALFLLVGGDGPLSEQFKRRVGELAVADRARFVGLLPEDDLPALLRAVDVYVSATAVDGTSVTLLQALACATPVIISDTPGNRAWLSDESMSFAVDDIGALARSLVSTKIDRQHRNLRSGAALVGEVADWRRNSRVVAGQVMSDSL